MGYGGIEIVFCDLDGTLLNSGSSLDSIDIKDRQAVVSWIQRGKKFVIATGRDKRIASEIKKHFGSSVDLIASNGASVFIDQKEVYKSLINHENFMLFNKMFQTLDSTRGFIAIMDDLNVVESRKQGVSPWYRNRKVESFDSYIGSNESKEIYKILCKFVDSHCLDISKLQLKELLFNSLEVYTTGASVIEVVNKDVSKWNSIKKYCAIKEIDIEKICVIGDEDNDFTMIKNSPLSFAISSGKQHVKEAATKVVNNVYEMFQLID